MTNEVKRPDVDDKYLNLDKIKIKSLIQAYTDQSLTYEEVTSDYILLLNNASDTYSFALTGENLDHVESVIISLNPRLESNVELISTAMYYLLSDEAEFNEVARWLDSQVRSALISDKDMLNSMDPTRNNLNLTDKVMGFVALFYDQFMITISPEEIVQKSTKATEEKPTDIETGKQAGPYFNTADTDLLKAVREGDTQTVNTLLIQGARR